MKKLLIFIILVMMPAGIVLAHPISSSGFSGNVFLDGSYSIGSSNMPGLFYNDEGSTGKFETVGISPTKTVYSNEYVKYSDGFDTDKWKDDSYSSYGIARGTTFGVSGNETALYPELKNESTYIKYRFNITAPANSVILNLTGDKRESVHSLTVWASRDNTTYSKIIDFNEAGKTNKQAEIINYVKDNQTWIEFRFFRNSSGTSMPRIFDISAGVIYKDAAAIPDVYAPKENILFFDGFDTDKWKDGSYSSYGIDRGTTFGVSGNETALYPELKNESTYIKYRFNITAPANSVILNLTGDKRESVHSLTVWASRDNMTYSKILEFNDVGKTTKQADIINYIKDNQTWIEFRFFRNSSGTSMPRIFDFSIKTTTHEWHPSNVTIGGNIEIPTRTIDRDHFYYFAPHYPSPAGATAARSAYLGSKYSAIDINSQRAVLGSFVQSDADITLTYGTPLFLGSGFVLEIEDMGAKDNQAVVVLKKDGKLLDWGTYEAGKTYSFKTEVANVKDTELLKADVISVFKSSFNNRVELKHVYLLDTNATVIKQGDSFGNFEVDLTDFDKDKDTDITIRLKKDATFTLARNSTIDLFGGLSIKVADSDNLRFAMIKKFTKSGTYQQTGPYGNYGQPYDINSFDAPGLFTYDIDKNDTLESLSISSGPNRINDIKYSTFNKNNRIAYLGKTYHVVPSGEKMALNEILKEENEKTVVRYGSPLYIEGYTLELLDAGERTALLQLKKGNTVLEKSSVDSGDRFVYKKPIEGKEIEIFNATVKSVFRSDFAALAELENLVLLNDTSLIVKDGDTIGEDYSIYVTDINGDGAADIMVKLKSGKSFGVSEDSTTGILGGYMSIKAYETTFLPIRSVTVSMDVNPADSVVPAATPEISAIAIATPQPAQTIRTASLQASSAVEAQEVEETPAKVASSNSSRSPPMNVAYILGGIGIISLSISAYRWFRFQRF